jgi:hypothetical protein
MLLFSPGGEEAYGVSRQPVVLVSFNMRLTLVNAGSEWGEKL